MDETFENVDDNEMHRAGLERGDRYAADRLGEQSQGVECGTTVERVCERGGGAARVLIHLADGCSLRETAIVLAPVYAELARHCREVVRITVQAALLMR